MAKQRVFKSKDKTPGLAGSSLIRPSYNDGELKKAIDVEINELIPQPKVPNFNLVTLDDYNTLLSDFNNIITQLETTNISNRELELEVENLKNQVEILQTQLESAGELTDDLKKQVEDLNSRLNKAMSDFNSAIQRATQAESRNAELSGQVSALNAQVAALQSQINSLNSLISGGAASGGGGGGGGGGTTTTTTRGPSGPSGPSGPGGGTTSTTTTRAPGGGGGGGTDGTETETPELDLTEILAKYPPDKYIVFSTRCNIDIGDFGIGGYEKINAGYPYVEFVIKDFEGKIIANFDHWESQNISQPEGNIRIAFYDGEKTVEKLLPAGSGTYVEEEYYKEEHNNSIGFVGGWHDPLNVDYPKKNIVFKQKEFTETDYSPRRYFEFEQLSDTSLNREYAYDPLRAKETFVYLDNQTKNRFGGNDRYPSSSSKPYYFAKWYSMRGTNVIVFRKPRKYRKGATPGSYAPRGLQINEPVPEYNIYVKFSERWKPWGSKEKYYDEVGSWEDNPGQVRFADQLFATVNSSPLALKVQNRNGLGWALTNVLSSTVAYRPPWAFDGVGSNRYSVNYLFKGFKLNGKPINPTQDGILLDGHTSLEAEFDREKYGANLSINHYEFDGSEAYSYYNPGIGDLTYRKMIDTVMVALHRKPGSGGISYFPGGRPFYIYGFDLFQLPQTSYITNPLLANFEYNFNEELFNVYASDKLERLYKQFSADIRSNPNIKILNNRYIYADGTLSYVANVGYPPGSLQYEGRPAHLKTAAHTSNKNGNLPHFQISILKVDDNPWWDFRDQTDTQYGPLFRNRTNSLLNYTTFLRESAWGLRWNNQIDPTKTGYGVEIDPIPSWITSNFDFYNNDVIVPWGQLQSREGYQLGNGPTDIWGNQLLTSNVNLVLKLKNNLKSEGNLKFNSGTNESRDISSPNLDLSYFNQLQKVGGDSFGLEWNIPFNPYRSGIIVPIHLYTYSQDDINSINKRIDEIKKYFENFIKYGHKIVRTADGVVPKGTPPSRLVGQNLTQDVSKTYIDSPILHLKDIDHLHFSDLVYVDTEKDILKDQDSKLDRWDIGANSYESYMSLVKCVDCWSNINDNVRPDRDVLFTGDNFIKLLNQTKSGRLTYTRPDPVLGMWIDGKQVRPVATVFLLIANYKPLGSSWKTIDPKMKILTAKWENTGADGTTGPPGGGSATITVTLQRGSNPPRQLNDNEQIEFDNLQDPETIDLNITTNPSDIQWEWSFVDPTTNPEQFILPTIVNNDSTGQGTIRIQILPNQIPSRSAVIRIKGRGQYLYLERLIRISHKGKQSGTDTTPPSLTVSPQTLSIGVDGTTTQNPAKIEVKTVKIPNWRFEITGDKTWFTVNRNGNFLEIISDKNNSSDSRQFTISIIPIGVVGVSSANVTVTQFGNTTPNSLDTDPKFFQIDANPTQNVRSFNLIASNNTLKWKVYIDPKFNWISVTDDPTSATQLMATPQNYIGVWKSAMESQGSKEIKVKIEKNTSPFRIASLNFETFNSSDYTSNAYVRIEQNSGVVTQEDCTNLIKKLAYNANYAYFDDVTSIDFYDYIVTKTPNIPGIYNADSCGNLTPAPSGYYYTDEIKVTASIVYWDGEYLYSLPTGKKGNGPGLTGRGDTGNPQLGGQDIPIWLTQVENQKLSITLNDIFGLIATWYLLSRWDYSIF